MIKMSQKNKIKKKLITIEELEDSPDVYNIELKIKTSFNSLGNIKIDVKWIARLIMKDIFSIYLDDKYLKIVDFQIDIELFNADFNSIKNQKKVWFYNIYNNKQQNFIREVWFAQIRTEERDILFFD